MIRQIVRNLRESAWRLRWRGLNLPRSRHECYICHKGFGKFYPYRQGWQSLGPVVQQLDLIGSDVVNFGCPYCRSNDRERHLFMYFDRLKLWESLQAATILHFAPERNLSERIKGCKPARYVKGDLYPEDLYRMNSEIERVDLTDIKYPDGTFDYVICNHVLEHVPADTKAYAEIHRVLKPGGRAILQTPFSAMLTRTIEDPGLKSDAVRLLIYGQEDHVRLYGRDIFDRIQASGLRLALCRHLDVSTAEEASRFGMNPKEDLILVRRPTLDEVKNDAKTGGDTK